MRLKGKTCKRCKKAPAVERHHIFTKKLARVISNFILGFEEKIDPQTKGDLCLLLRSGLGRGIPLCGKCHKIANDASNNIADILTKGFALEIK